MTDRLKGKVALVTAAGQGIGRAIAEAFIREGAGVIATDLAADKLKGLNARKACKLDVLALADIEALAREVRSEFGRLDIVVNCAGYVHQGTIFDCSDRDWDFSFDLNVKSMHRIIKTFLPLMLENKAGSIVNISSAVSSIRGVPSRYVYGATKAAVIGLTKAVAADFIKQGIRCNAICPGTIESPSLDERIAVLSQETGRSIEQVQQDFVVAAADGPARHPRRGRGARPLSRQRRGKLHYRPAASRRWRHGAVRGDRGRKADGRRSGRMCRRR